MVSRSSRLLLLQIGIGNALSTSRSNGLSCARGSSGGVSRPGNEGGGDDGGVIDETLTWRRPQTVSSVGSPWILEWDSTLT